jgi:hypothetical protein
VRIVSSCRDRVSGISDIGRKIGQLPVGRRPGINSNHWVGTLAHASRARQTHRLLWPITSIEHNDVLLLLGQCRYAKIGPHRAGQEPVVIGFESSSRRKRDSSNVNGVSWVHDVLGTKYLRLLAELQVPVQGGRRDPSGRRPSSRHRLHGEYVRERASVGLTIKQFYAARGALGVTVSNRPIATWKRLLFCIVGAAMILVGVRFFLFGQ